MSCRRLLRTVPLTAGMTVGFIIGIPDAETHQSTAVCNTNGAVLTLAENETTVRNGDTLQYTVALSNLGSGSMVACDVTDATVTVTLPALDGTPTGQKVTVVSGATYPAGTPVTPVATVPFTVAVAPGVSHLVASASISGTLHNAATDDHIVSAKTLSAAVTQPHTTLSVTPSTTAGAAPLTVTYTYVETNDSSTNSPISNVGVTDDLCAPLTPTGGDNGNGILDAGEKWTYSCTRLFEQPGVFTNRALGTGRDAADGAPVPLEEATATVTVGPAPQAPAPQAPAPQAPAPQAPAPQVLGARELPRTS